MQDVPEQLFLKQCRDSWGTQVCGKQKIFLKNYHCNLFLKKFTLFPCDIQHSLYHICGILYLLLRLGPCLRLAIGGYGKTFFRSGLSLIMVL